MNLEQRALYIDSVVEQERLLARSDADRQCELILNDAAQRGVLQSGVTISQRLKARIESSERVLRRRIAAEEEVLSKERESAPAEWRIGLENDIKSLLSQVRQELEAELRKDVTRFLRADRDVAPLIAGRLMPELNRLADYYLREVEVLQGRFTLDTEARGREAKVATGNVTINIHHSTVGSLNLGTIIGNIQANLSALKADGHDQVVEALKGLTEAIGNAQELGDGRREALEQVALISAEAEKPPAERRVGAVKAVLTALQAALSASANLIKVGEFAWPHIKNYFNLKWGT